MSELSGLVSYAEEREAEKATRSLYLAHFVISKMQGSEPMGYEEYISAVMTAGYEKKTRDPADIERDMDAVERAYRARKEAQGG